jgi:hypothetical protein
MRKQFRQTTKFAAWLITIMLASAIFCPYQAFAQNGKPIAKPGDVWYLSFTVTMKGSGTIQPEPGTDDPTIYWKVDRNYSGTIDLADGKLFNRGSENTAADLKAMRFVRFKSDSAKMDVKVDDHIILKNEEDICEVLTKTLDKRTWEADVNGWTSNSRFDTSLTFDNQKHTYNVSIPIALAAAGSDLLLFKRILETTRKPSGGVSSSETKILEEEKYSIFDVKFPRIFDLIESNRIHHNDYVALKSVNDAYEWTSKEETVHDHILPNIDVEDNVKLQVFYRFRK